MFSGEGPWLMLRHGFDILQEAIGQELNLMHEKIDSRRDSFYPPFPPDTFPDHSTHEEFSLTALIFTEFLF